MTTHLEGLNQAQREAVTHDGGPLAVLAGPGTGKTRVLTRRVAHLVRDRGVDPARILALTFTTKAAEEMRERLTGLMGLKDASALTACTFNAFGATLLRRFGDEAGLPPSPQLLDSAQRKRLNRQIVQEHGLFAHAAALGIESAIDSAERTIRAMFCAALTPDGAHRRVSARLEELEHAEDTEETAAAREEARRLLEVCRLWHLASEARRERGWIDFDDQIAMATELLRDAPRARAMAHTDHRHVLVDEFQDVNRAQIGLLAALVPPERLGAQLTVVGDDDQSIYGFRGADDRAFERFERRWGEHNGVRVVSLETNYRSAPRVLELAAPIIGRAHERFRADKTIEADPVRGAEIAAKGAGCEGVDVRYDEAGVVIAAMIHEQMLEDPGLELSRIAVIVRKTKYMHQLDAALRLQGIPTRCGRPPAAHEEDSVRDVFAWLGALASPMDRHAWSRVLRRPPVGLNAGEAGEIEASYDAARRALRHGEEGARALPGDGSVADFALERMARDEGLRARGERFGALLGVLRPAAATKRADELIGLVVRACDLAHAEALDRRARARRVTALMSMLAFARERQARLEPPGGAAEFLRYHEDLEGEEKGFASRSLEGDFLEGLADEGEQGGGVRLLTAHSSKGLEFDTVFLPRIEALYGYKGYPDLQGRGEDEIVPGWLDPDGGRDERGARAVTEDEERRLFYVACTRAERRLVLLGKLPGAKSSGVNYFVEARDDGTLDRVRTASEVLDHASERGVYVAGRGGDGLGELDVVTRADRAAAIRRDARRRAAEAMDLLDDPSAGEAELGAARRSIERATLDIAAAARGARGDELPGWLGDERGRAIASRLRERGEEEGDPYTRPLEAPLRLSFSHVDLYTACPRCYYARHVYGIEEARGASLVVGKVVHGAIEAFLLRQRLADAEGGAAPSGEDLLALGRSLALGELAGAGLSEAEVGQQLAQVGAQLRVYLERFHDADDEILEIERRLEVPLEVDGVRHTLVAKFDRLDRIEGGVRLIDYKTGAPSKKYVSPSASADLQLGIYRIALDAYFEGEVSGEAEYWLLATGEVGRVSLDRLREKSEKTVGTIETAARGMMAGRFDRDARGCRGLCELISGP